MIHLLPNAMSRLFLASLFTINLTVNAQDELQPQPLDYVPEGVYALDGMAQTTIIELKEGRFRYWFWSDLRIGRHPEYPVSGTYTKDGGSITFVRIRRISTNPRQKPVTRTEHWQCMNFKGKTTLWTTNAIKGWRKNPKGFPHPVLFLTKTKPEDIWKKRKGSAPPPELKPKATRLRTKPARRILQKEPGNDRSP